MNRRKFFGACAAALSISILPEPRTVYIVKLARNSVYGNMRFRSLSDVNWKSFRSYDVSSAYPYTLKNYYGAGSSASAMLKQWKVKDRSA